MLFYGILLFLFGIIIVVIGWWCVSGPSTTITNRWWHDERTRRHRRQIWRVATQNKFSHAKNRLGYRSDCTGFIAHMWGIDSHYGDGGPRTLTRCKGGDNLLNWGDKLATKHALKRGDILLVPDTHAVMFDKWADRTRTAYFGYEMCNVPGCRGFVYHKIDYPYTASIRPNFRRNNVVLLRRR